MDSKDKFDFNNTGEGPLVVPGFNGCPVDTEISLLYGQRFRHGANDYRPPRLTVREIAMLRLMDALTDKPEWERKVFDDEIVAKWRAEALAIPLISEKAWEWCLAELRDDAVTSKEKGWVHSYNSAARIVKGDRVVSAALQEELKAGVRPLLDVPAEKKDWHPGSDDKVLNLVHPSLFPLVYGKSLVLSQGDTVTFPDIFASSGKGEVAPSHLGEGEPEMWDDYYGLDNEEQRPQAQPRQRPIARRLFNRPALGPTHWSHRFQWLPCEVAFAGDQGTDVKITSYINNLHPTRNSGLYRTVEKLLGLSIPLWNEILVSRWDGRKQERIKTYGGEYAPPFPDWAVWSKLPGGRDDAPSWAEFYEKAKAFIQLPEPEGSDDVEENEEEDTDESDNDEDEIDLEEEERRSPPGPLESFERRIRNAEAASARLGQLREPHNSEAATNARHLRFKESMHNAIERKWKKLRTIVIPEPGISFSYEEWKTGAQKPIIDERPSWRREVTGRSIPLFVSETWNLEESFRDQGLQVIVKLASIELTPEKPEYDGGNWHIEGMLNEHIVATAIYYYDVENMTEARLELRQEASLDDMSLNYEQDEHEPLAEVFGTESMRDEAAIQELGSVATPEGRLLVFPNTMQHRVSSFRLQDPTRAGHRRFIVLWLVDPHYRVASTRNVPPQRHDWWAESAYDKIDFTMLPAELTDMVRDGVGEWPMGLDDAKRYRLELMKERTRMTEAVETQFETYNLCEH